MGTRASDGIARSSGRLSELIDFVSTLDLFLTVPYLGSSAGSRQL